MVLTTPQDFDFWQTVISHGWYDLPPFKVDHERKTLHRVLTLPDFTPVRCSVRERGSTLQMETYAVAPLSRTERSHLTQQLRTCLRLDESFVSFHRTTRRYAPYRWIASARAGRLLRAPSAFEDTVKMLCTTNCSWGLTVAMVGRIHEEFGRVGLDGCRAFPDPAAIAGTTEAILRRRCKTGYRAPYILEFARRVTSGELDCERWRNSPLTTGALEDEMRSVRGIGPYAAGNLLKLAGRYERLGLDSWVRTRFATLHARGRRVSDGRIEREYAQFGEWRGLIFWLEMTRHWHDDKFQRGRQ
jgi:N-glycosylase/DNA lyase